MRHYLPFFPIAALLAVALSSCARPLAKDAPVAAYVQGEDAGLAAAARSAGIALDLRQGTEAWTSRLRADLSSSKPAELYDAEWGAELFQTSAESSLADVQALWRRTTFAKSEPRWLEGIETGPRGGFLPTSGYTWGLFFNTTLLARLGGNGPSTLPQLESLFDKAKAAGIVPVALGASFGWPAAAWFTMLDLRTNGPDAVRDRNSGKRAWDDASAKTVLAKLADWRDRGWFSPEAAGTGMPESIAAVESGRSLCVLMGAFAVERLTKAGSTTFVPFPAVPRGRGNNAEIGGLVGFAVPKAEGADKDSEARARESAVALVDAYLLGGGSGSTTETYRVPLIHATGLAKGKSASALPGIAGIQVEEAAMLRQAKVLVPSFERAVAPQALQNSIPLWASFLAPLGPQPADFAASLQKAMAPVK
jgi:hypothetical protein